MSLAKMNDLADLKPGSFNWQIQVRIIRFWRGVSRSGEIFKGFNLLLLDDKNDRIHAFVPGAIAEKLEDAITVGLIFNISNFAVKEYRADEKFRCVQNNKQIIVTAYTKVTPVPDTDTFIPENMFDLYDLSDLKSIANQNVYLTDVIGVVEKDSPLRKFTNCNGADQCQLKFEITDGRCTINVTFWDDLAIELQEKLLEDFEYPLIIIIASAKVSSWEDKTELSNVTATDFYINYQHHSVLELRKMLSTPLFSNYDFSSQLSEKAEKLTAKQIKLLGPEYIERQVICNLTFRNVPELKSWHTLVCTTCFREIRQVDGHNTCVMCNRKVPHPDKKFNILVDCFDVSGNLEIMLEDRSVRTLIGKTVFELEDEGINLDHFPHIFKVIENQEYAVKIKITGPNINNSCQLYKVIDIYPISCLNESSVVESNKEQDQVQLSMTQTSTSTYHLDGLSPTNFKTPEVTKKKVLSQFVEKEDKLKN